MKIYNTRLSIKSLFLLFTILIYGCDIKDNEVEVNSSFLRVYDNNQFDGSYIPLDIQQTSDGGYLILSGRRIRESNFVGINILKIDATGTFVNEFKMEENFVHPVYSLIKNDEGFYFFCMDAVSLQAHIAKISEDDGEVESITPVQSTNYPLYASASDDNSFILQSYNITDKQTVLSVVNGSGNVSKRKVFGIGAGEDVEKPLIEHFTRTGKQLPFLSGKTLDGMFYFNGFFNYTFSLVFTNLSSNEPSGVVQGQQDDGGISALLPLEVANKYALSTFNFGDNYLHSNSTLSKQGISSTVDLVGFSMPELQPDARVILKRVTVNAKKSVVYGSNTKNGQILLLGYDEVTGELKGTKYLGFSYPYEIAGFVQTEDEGLAVAALTYVAGRFPRICLFKLSKEELKEIVE
jgi:hypothetical protein